MLPRSDTLDLANASTTSDAAPPAVSVEHVSVRFWAKRELHRSMMGRLRHVRKDRSKVEALKDVSFQVPQGSVYSVIGSNGAGKSTLFRVVGGIIAPNEGQIVVRARITPLLSLGVGFNPKLSGRENVLLGGLASGLSREQVLDRMEDVIEFAELGEAIDYPIRTYSTGMGSRLGFAVASHLDPDLILIDEALAGGDAKFKEKCMAKIDELCSGSCTVMVVSHGLGLVRVMADWCLWLEDGEVAMEGTPDEVVAAYMTKMDIHEETAGFEDI